MSGLESTSNGNTRTLSGNVFSGVRHAQGPEEFFTLMKDGNVKVEKIVSHGTKSEWFDQDTGEFVVLLKGAARLLFEGDTEEHVMEEGSFVVIPKHRRHKVTYTSPDEPTVWLAIHWK